MHFEGINNVVEFSHGHRGVIYTGDIDGKKIAIKSAIPKSKAVGNIAREAVWLELLNHYGIGPKFLYSKGNYFVYEFVEGELIKDFRIHASLSQMKKVFVTILKQCALLDSLHINKEEMHNPYKHIIVGQNIVLLDFERCKNKLTPQNVTQFVQYICKISEFDERKKKKILDLSQLYKKNYDPLIIQKINLIVEA